MKQAILWKYGKCGLTKGRKYPSRYDNIISQINRNLPELNKIFVLKTSRDIKIRKLKDILDNTLHRIVTKAWITHLYFPETCKIIDQHNFRAMHYLLLKKKPSYEQKLLLINILPSSWDDVQTFEQFFRELKVQNPDVDDRSLDKYLMVYGKSLKKQLKANTKYSRINIQRARNSVITMAEATILETWGGRSSFHYNGSVKKEHKFSIESNHSNFWLLQMIMRTYWSTLVVNSELWNFKDGTCRSVIG